MSEVARLEPLQHMARREAEQAARDLGQALTRQEALHRQHADLLRYLNDYRAELDRALAHGLRVDRLQAYRHMLERLGSALARQQGLLDQQAAICTQAQRRYVERQARLQALDDLIAGRRKAERSRQGVREQHMLDDLTQARWRAAGATS